MPSRLLDCIRRVALLRDGGGLSDGQLLALFVKHRDEDAFTALLNRHSPMVIGVCRRILGNSHDAEDAFQATFFIFARKAATVTARDAFAGWLYRVAYRTALEARARIVRRQSREHQVNDVPDPAVEPDEGQSELLARLDKEIDRLPDKYRVPVILCELEGRSRREAAHQLGLPEGTLSWRLAHAKKMLAKRLLRYGLAVSGSTLAEAMMPGTVSAFLRATTVKTVVTAGSVSANVLGLTEGVMKTMLLSKLKITLIAGALMLLGGLGATGLTYRATAEQPKQKGYATVEGRPQADDLDAFRLEFEALRKELRATKERVKTLEGEVSALKGQSGNKIASGKGYNSSLQPSGTMQGPMMQMMMGRGGMGQGMGGAMQMGRGRGMGGMMGQGMGGMMQKGPSDPMSDAEAALKKVRENPGDKKAVEALERALKQLKEREKPAEGNR